MKKKFFSIAVIAMIMTVMLAVSAYAVAVTETGVMYDGASELKTVTLTLSEFPEGAQDITAVWASSSSNITLNATSGTSITVTAQEAGSAMVMVNYSYKKLPAAEEGGEPQVFTDTLTTNLTVNSYALESITASVNRDYVKGQAIQKSDITVTATYTDDSVDNNFTKFGYNPMVANTDGETIMVIADGTEVTATFNISVSEISTKDLVDSVSIAYPTASTEFKVGDILKASDVEILVTYLDGTKGTISIENEDITVSGISFANGKYTFSSEDAKTAPVLEVTYADKPKQSVTLKVVEKTPEQTASYIVATPSKIEYSKGETINKTTDLKVSLKKADGSSSELSTNQFRVTPSTALNTTGTVTVTVTVTLGDGTQLTDTYIITVKEAAPVVPVTGFANTTSYKAVLDEDAKVKIGDELDWEDLFDYVYIKYTESNKTKYKKISDNDDLEDWLGSSAELYVIVSGKDGSAADTVEEDDIEDGEVALKLYLEYANDRYSLSFDMPVSDVACTVTVYRPNGTTKIGDSKVFDDLKEALEYLEDKDDIIDDFSVSSSYKNSFIVKIKLGEDQDLAKFEFAPDHEQEVIIDLNGCELKMKSEWIDYDDCEDLKVIVTNTNEDEYGTVIYSDLSTTLIVAEDSELEFTEGEIPMESDAACMVTIYRSGTSSTVLGTKVYDSLKEALEALEEQDEVVDNYDISSSYEDTFVVKMKLGEDQTLTNFTFVPDYDTTVTIDLNGYTLKLKSEWIDYDDCEDLVVYVNNTNKDKKATLTYSDLSTSLSIAKDDSSLKFEEDEVPGIYDVTISSVTNGKITASPSRTTVAHGGTVTFTITPNVGYEISSVKVGNKSITTSTSGYSVSSKGVGTYKMEDITADVTISAVFKATSSSSGAAADWTNPFTDVSEKAQYYDAVAFVCSEGLFNGMTATKFEPTTTMTRAMFVTVLGRLADIDVSKYSGTSFTDVSKNDPQISWATPYIEWAVQNGITQGTGNGKFSPNDPITHQQMYLFMYRYALFVENMSTPLTGVSLSGIKDAGEIADWAEEGVKFASKNGILITSGGKLTPTDNALRCELAMLLNGFCTKVLGYND